MEPSCLEIDPLALQREKGRPSEQRCHRENEPPFVRWRNHGEHATKFLGRECDGIGNRLAVILGNGTRKKNALELGRDLVRDGLPAFARREWGGSRARGSVGAATAAKIAAALELGRRIASTTDSPNGPLRDPVALARTLIARYAHQVQERVGAVYLDARSRIVREREIYVGTLDCATVSTRDIFRHALDDHAAAVIVFHNHPSGDPAPSGEDLLFTRKLVEAGKVLGIDVLDHLILGANRFASLRQLGNM